MIFKFRLLLILSILAGTVFVSGCRTFRGDDFPYHVARFYMETSEIYPERYSQAVMLPYTETVINIDPRARIGEWDIARVDVFEAELGDAVAFHLVRDAVRDLQMMSYNNQGRRIVLTVNDRVVGAQRIHRGIDNGVITMYLEVPDEKLEELAEYITKTSEAARRRM